MSTFVSILIGVALLAVMVLASSTLASPAVFYRAKRYRNDLNAGLSTLLGQAPVTCSRDRYRFSFFFLQESVACWTLGQNILDGKYDGLAVRLTWFQSAGWVWMNLEIPTSDLGELELTIQNLPELVEDLVPTISRQVLKMLGHSVSKITFHDKSLALELHKSPAATFGGRSTTWYVPAPKVVQEVEWVLEDAVKLYRGLPESNAHN